MTPQDIIDATNTFGHYGVPEENIFQEVMRARYLDYFLFSNPSNAQYGISIEDLYENMKKTADRLGLYGDPSLPFQIHVIQNLGLHFPAGEKSCLLYNPVCQG